MCAVIKYENTATKNRSYSWHSNTTNGQRSAIQLMVKGQVRWFTSPVNIHILLAYYHSIIGIQYLTKQVNVYKRVLHSMVYVGICW